MIYEIKIDIKNYATLTIYTESEEMKNKILTNNSQLFRTIPITKITGNLINKSNIDYTDAIIIIDGDKNEMYYDKKYNVSMLKTNKDKIRFPDLVYICLAMFSNILSRNKKYLLHSSSLAYSPEKGFVLSGDANAGKTSLAYEMMSKYDCKLISNDHSVIGIENGKPMILGGTKEIQMRLGAIELYFPELYKKINMNVPDKWSKKLVVNDYIDDELILSQSEDKIPLTDIYSISTTSSGSTFVREKDKIDQFLYLYENMSKILKGSYNYITGFDFPMPSMENEKNLKELSELCKKIVEECNVCEARGSLDGIGKALIRKYEK